GNYLPAQAVIINAQTLQPLTVISTRTQNMEGQMVDAKVAIVSDVAPTPVGYPPVGPYFIIALKEAGQMWRINWSLPGFPIDKLTNVGHVLHDGFLNPANTRFYIASQTDNWMSVIDVVNWSLVTQISTGTTPHPGSGAVWTDILTGTEYAGTTHVGEGKIAIWDISNNTLMGNIPTAGAGLFIRSHENSPYVWADALLATSPEITVFEKAPPFTVVTRITEGIQTLHPEFTNTGAFVYISDWQGNVVRVYNATTFAKVTEISGVTTPTGIFNTSRRLETLGH
ncbi:MAG: cytochrome D1 domain-containing protein, partial [Planctomycetota bacterium]